MLVRAWLLPLASVQHFCERVRQRCICQTMAKLKVLQAKMAAVAPCQTLTARALA